MLDGGPEVLRDVAITGFVGYNFGCMIASDTLFDTRRWVGVQLSNEDIADFEVLRDVAMVTIFLVSIYGVRPYVKLL